MGVDVIALTRGIGEHDEDLLKELLEVLAWLSLFELVGIPAEVEGLNRATVSPRSTAQLR